MPVYLGYVKSDESALHFGVPQGSVLGPRIFNQYAEDVSELFNQHHLRYHLFPDDMQWHCGGRPAEAPSMVSHLERCIADVSAWYASRRLQLNGDETELLWFGSATHLRQLPSARSISVNNSVVQPVTVVRDLGVWSCQCASTSHVLLRSASFICAVCARFVDNLVVTSLHNWCQLSCYRDWTIATLSSPVSQRQLWHRCSES